MSATIAFLIVVLQILPHLMLRIDKNRSLDTDAEKLVTTMRNVICRPEGTDEDYPSLAVVKEALVRLVPKYGVCQMFAGGAATLCARDDRMHFVGSGEHRVRRHDRSENGADDNIHM